VQSLDMPIVSKYNEHSLCPLSKYRLENAHRKGIYMNNPDQKRGMESWGSRLGFIMAASGFAIGLGNIWRFPYLAGENGGGAFLLIYIVIFILIGIPLFLVGDGLGIRAQSAANTGLTNLHDNRNP